MFRAVPLPIIRSLLTVHLALVYVIWFEVSLRAGPALEREICYDARSHEHKKP